MERYLTTILLCAAIILIALGIHTNNLILTVIGGFLVGAQWADEHPDIEAIKAIEDHAYFAGSEAMREKMTNKACEWFYEQLNNLKMGCRNIMEFIECFKKSMDL